MVACALAACQPSRGKVPPSLLRHPPSFAFTEPLPASPDDTALRLPPGYEAHPMPAMPAGTMRATAPSEGVDFAWRNGALLRRLFKPGSIVSWQRAAWNAGGLVWLEISRQAAFTPEERTVAHSPSGRFYLALPPGANIKPWPPAPKGAVLELSPPWRDGAPDPTAARYDTALLLQGGDPARPADQAFYLARADKDVWLSLPSLLAVSGPAGDEALWIATRGMPETEGRPDAIFVLPLQGPWRGRPHRFALLPSRTTLARMFPAYEGAQLTIGMRDNPNALRIHRTDGRPLLIPPTTTPSDPTPGKP